MFAPKPIAASGLPGLPSIFGMEKQYTTPKSVVPFVTNVTARSFPGWTYNPLGFDTPERGYLGNASGSVF